MPAFHLLPFDAPGLELTPFATLSITVIPSINNPVRDRCLDLEPTDQKIKVDSKVKGLNEKIEVARSLFAKLFPGNKYPKFEFPLIGNPRIA